MKIKQSQLKKIIQEELADLLEDEQKLEGIDWKELGHEVTMGAFRKRKPIQKPEETFGKDLPEHSLEPLTAKEIKDQYGISPEEYVRLQTVKPSHLNDLAREKSGFTMTRRHRAPERKSTLGHEDPAPYGRGEPKEAPKAPAKKRAPKDPGVLRFQSVPRHEGKITKTQLKRIIKEELQQALREQ